MGRLIYGRFASASGHTTIPSSAIRAIATNDRSGNNDLWIAAHALASRFTLVTNSEKEFRRVPGLRNPELGHVIRVQKRNRQLAFAL
jgi:predicted nucleic acid-binding protein